MYWKYGFKLISRSFKWINSCPERIGHNELFSILQYKVDSYNGKVLRFAIAEDEALNGDEIKPHNSPLERKEKSHCVYMSWALDPWLFGNTCLDLSVI